MEVGIHPGLEDGDTTEFVEFGGVGVVIERAGDQDIEASIPGLAGG